ncbi:NAD-P-binding protein [Crucibulum laeve]|uniref:NAD-P-binding protein n=1 Tax=Crucibulum laeve TaxID=68775 RepID=A0A5C3LJJ6_9AGAR|nr:NAD-P-binding protein [Crucibulum laeve]
MQTQQVWLITGSSSGFGRSMAEAALKGGHCVVATLRNPQKLANLEGTYSTDRLLVLGLDVTKKDDVSNAFAIAKAVFGRIDVVFNNAGVAIVGEVEAVPDEVGRSIFEVLFWGAMNVTREAIKYMRENEPVDGHILQISSLYGIVGESGTGHYSAAKFALEGLTESLVKELEPNWKIKVTIIEPGPFITDLPDNGIFIPSAHPPLSNGQSRTHPATKIINGDTNKAAQAFLRLVLLPDPPLRLPMHKNVVEAFKMKAASLLKDAEKYESWSDDLLLPEELWKEAQA